MKMSLIQAQGMDKNLLRNGDIILFHTKGFSLISWGIRLLTESFWNHAGCYVVDVNKKGYVIEALGRGVSKTPIEKYVSNKNYTLKVVRLIPEAFKNDKEYFDALVTATNRIEGEVGKKYDWWAIAWLGFIYLGKGSYKKSRKHIPIGNPLQSRNKFFCSELVCSAFQGLSSIIENLFAGEKYPEADCSTITPKDCNKSKWVETIWGRNDIL